MKACVLCSVMLLSCAPILPEPAPVVVGDTCVKACEKLRALGCEAGKDTPDGASCVDVCYQTEATGWTTMHPRCVSIAGTCAEAEKVSQYGCD